MLSFAIYTNFLKLVKIPNVFIRIIMFTGKDKQHRITAEFVHILPYHNRQIDACMRAVQADDHFIAGPVHHPDLARTRDIDQDKLGTPVRVTSPHHIRIGSINVKNTLDFKGDIYSAFDNNKPAAVIAVFIKLQQFYFSCFRHKTLPSKSNTSPSHTISRAGTNVCGNSLHNGIRLFHKIVLPGHFR